MSPEEHDFFRSSLIRLRKRLRLSQLQASLGSGVQRTTLSLWEGGHQRMSDEQVERVRAFLFAEWNALRAPQVPAGCERPIVQEAAQ